MSQSAVGELFEISLADQIELMKLLIAGQELNNHIQDRPRDKILPRMRAVLRTLEGLR